MEEGRNKNQMEGNNSNSKNISPQNYVHLKNIYENMNMKHLEERINTYLFFEKTSQREIKLMFLALKKRINNFYDYKNSVKFHAAFLFFFGNSVKQTLEL